MNTTVKLWIEKTIEFCLTGNFNCFWHINQMLKHLIVDHSATTETAPKSLQLISLLYYCNFLYFFLSCKFVIGNGKINFFVALILPLQQMSILYTFDFLENTEKNQINILFLTDTNELKLNDVGSQFRWGVFYAHRDSPYLPMCISSFSIHGKRHRSIENRQWTTNDSLISWKFQRLA